MTASLLDYRLASLSPRLSDWTGAGYKGGQPIPTVTGGRVRFFPAGSHLLSGQEVWQPGQVFRGAGEGVTFLDFTKHLCQLFGPSPCWPGSGNTKYTSWGGLAHAENLTEIGLEDLTIRMPARTMAPHHREPGWNGVNWGGITHSWMKNVTILNADSGVLCRYVSNCTFENVSFGWPGMTKNSEGNYGHYSLLLGRECHHNLVTGGTTTRHARHQNEVQYNSHHNVFERRTEDKLAFGHHRGNPHHNLMTDCIGKDLSQFWRSGGNLSDGFNNGEGEVVWGVRGPNGELLSTLPKFSSSDWQERLLSIVGHTQNKLPTDLYKVWVEGLTTVDPVNVYRAQRGESSVPPPPPPSTAKFTIGQRVKATASLVIRSGPAKSTTQIGTQPSGAKATALEGPNPDAASGFTYWRLNFDGGTDGWAGEDKLVAL